MTYALIFGLICSLIPISLIARRFDWKSGLHLARRLTMPMGFVVTILHLMQLLGLMSTPEQIDQI